MRQVFWPAILIVLSPAITSMAQDANGNGIADRLELPGTQPFSPLPGPDYSLADQLSPATDCQNCHTTANPAGPYPPWNGSMMANAARDPVFWAQLDVAEADEGTDPNLIGARDICLRCHFAKGWLEGRSSGPVLADALRGMTMQENDLLGVQCEVCHRMVDPVSADPIDANMLSGLNTNPAVDMRVPPSYGDAMYVMDRYDVRRGPYSSTQIGWPSLVSQFLQVPADWPPSGINSHPLKLSAFHRSGNLCGTCHDVSNPVWTSAEPKGNAQTNFPIERTWTEWTNSIYATQGEAGNCQACHMNGVFNGALSGGASSDSEAASGPFVHMNDVHYHDFTGGNVWVPEIVSQMVQKFQTTKAAANPGANPVIGNTQAERDAFLNTNYAWVLKTLYPLGTYARNIGAQPPPLAFNAADYDSSSSRATATLQRAAQLSGSVTGSNLKVRVWNMTGHKLPTGYPEGRRMWLNVKFLQVNPATGVETLLAESGEYDPATSALYQDFNLDNLAGPKSYDVAGYTLSGASLGIGRRTQVYEARLHHQPSGVEFHFIQDNERLSDNRVPPIGWNSALFQSSKADQVIPAAYAGSQMVYYDNVTGPPHGVIEDTYNFDEVTYPVPANSDIAEVTLEYQSVSREYIEEVVAANPRTLIYPAAGGPSTFTRGDLLEHAWRTFSIAGQTRIPPVQMTKLRIALVDSDGDGLPDNWEVANGLNPNDATGNNGRNGDLDNDGRSNFIEFQEKTPANVADFVRTPVDLALVLDMSGSMNDPATGSSEPKIQVLKDAVDLFLTTWKQYAVNTDRIAVVYFSSGVSIESGGIIDFSALPAGVTVESRIDQLIAAVRGQSANGFTALGGGLEKALNAVLNGGAGHRKEVVVFTNGMQNYSPMVEKNMANNFLIQAEPVNAANGVYGDSGITDAGGPPFGTALPPLNVQIHTIGIGVSETPDDRWQNLLSGLSANTSGLNQFISRGFEVEGAFLNNLVQALRGFSPLVLSDYSRTLAAKDDTSTLEFPMDATARKATFILSWSGESLPGRLTFDLLAPDGKPVAASVRSLTGPNYQIAACYFPLAAPNGRPIDHTGAWKMVVRREGSVSGRANETRQRWKGAADFRAYLVADIPDMNFDVHFSQPVYRAGDKVQLQVKVSEGLAPIRTLSKVTAVISSPSAALGTLLSTTNFSRDQIQRTLTTGGDLLADKAAAKARLLLTDPRYTGQLRPRQQTFQLYDDGNAAHGDSLPGDGVFSAALGTASHPGLITAQVTVSGVTARNRTFTRRFTANVVVNNAIFSSTRSRISATLAGRSGPGWLVRLNVTPRDIRRDYLGPGFRDRVTFNAPGSSAISPVDDGLDGRYAQTLTVPSLSTAVGIRVDNDNLFQGSVSSMVASHYLTLLLLWILLLLSVLFLVWFIKRYGTP